MDESPQEPRLYRELASWFHLVTRPDDYDVEARFYGDLLDEAAEIPVRTVLELGSGGGNNASHMKKRYDMMLADLSRDMLDVSRGINPELEHVHGDMRALRLQRQFDGVFIHDAINYMSTEDDLRAAIETAFEHCRPGGAAVFAPDFVRETFRETTDHGGHDLGPRGLRYLEWTWDPDLSDDEYITDFAYLLRDEDGTVTVEHDRHICGVFARATWLRLIAEAGFRAELRSGIPKETAADIFIGMKPPDGD